MRKTIFILLFALLGVLSARAYDFEVDGIYYDRKYGTTDQVVVTYKDATYSERSDYSGSVVIPSTVEYGDKTYTVTFIGNDAFKNCSGLTSVTIPESVTTIWDRAFQRCTGLTSVTIPNTVTSIGDYAFYGCTSISGPLYNSKIFAYLPQNYSGEYAIPSGIQSIAGGAFSDCGDLTSVTIPDGVTAIGYFAFEDCSGLASVTIPNTVTSIGFGAFSDCSGLTSVTIPNSMTYIGERTFYNTGLTSVTIPNSVTCIYEYAFYKCSALTSVTIPESVTTIRGGAFSDCSALTSVTIPESVTSIGWTHEAVGECPVFDGTAISSPLYNSKIFACMPTGYSGEYVIPSGIQSIVSGAFRGCSGLTSVTIPESVTHIGRIAFAGCTGLTSITIPDSVTSIRDYAFYGCSGLTSMTIGKGVTWIGPYAFSSCSSLTSVTSLSQTPPSCSNYGTVFSVHDTLFVPRGCKAAYQTANEWREFTTIYESGFDGTGVVTALPNYMTMGSVTGSGQYEIGENVTLEAIPYFGHHFVKWDDGNTDNPRVLTVIADITLTAVFSDKYTVTVQPNDASMGYVAGSGKYEEGKQATLKATPYKGYHFEKWDDGDTDNPRLLTVSGDTTITAIFAKGAPTPNEISEADNFRVYVEGRTILLSEDRGAVQVYNMTGQCVYNGHATEIPVSQPGVYIVAVGQQRFKVPVR